MTSILTIAFLAVSITVLIEYNNEIKYDPIIQELEQKLRALKIKRKNIMDSTNIILENVKQVQKEFHLHRQEMREDNKSLNRTLSTFINNVGLKFDAQDKRMDVLEKSNAVLQKTLEFQDRKLGVLEENVGILTKIEERRSTIEEERKRRKSQILKKVSIWTGSVVGFFTIAWAIFTHYIKNKG